MAVRLEDNDVEADGAQLEEQLLPSKKDAQQRFTSLDLMRGFIMIVMAWDHVKDNMADLSQKGAETWSGPYPDFRNSFWFMFARIVSDICAPGFFFTMGLGMTFFAISRSKRGWSSSKIMYHFIERGAIVALLERIANVAFQIPKTVALLRGYDIVPIHTNVTYESKDAAKFLVVGAFGYFYVLTALGLSMILCSILLLPLFIKLDTQPESPISASKVGFIVCCMFFILSNIVIVHYQYGNPEIAREEFPGILAHAHTFWEYLVRLVIIPGPGQGIMNFGYPIIPWMGLTALGMGFGFWARKDFTHFTSSLGKASIACIILFICVRLFGGPFGNLRGYPRGDGHDPDDPVSFLIEFLYTSKYPPSIAYALWTMGVNFGLIYCFSRSSVDSLVDRHLDENEVSTFGFRLKTQLIAMIHTFGTVPLFFYLLHLLVIGVVTALLSFVHHADDGLFKVRNLCYLIPVWMLLILALYPACQWYGIFKNSKPAESWWRML